MLKTGTPRESEGKRGTAGRLSAIDGLRALAALWVVFFHFYAHSGARFPQVPGLDLFLRSGSTAVSLFLVLSGFCLYVPFAGGRTEKFKTREFFRRRARRLIPTYYAAMLLPIGLSLLGRTWTGSDALSFSQLGWQVLTHVTFIHTFFPSTHFGLNGSYWSLGLEWHLYLAMPLLILGVRRFGLPRVVALPILINVAYAVFVAILVARIHLAPTTLMVSAVMPNQLFGRWAEFALGMVAAELYVSGTAQLWAKRLTPWIPFGIALSLVVVRKGDAIGPAAEVFKHIMFGCVFFVLVTLVLARENLISRALAWRPFAMLGTMSYSLYLIHEPIVRVLSYQMHIHSPQQRFMLLVGSLPLIIALAACLFMLVERHSLTPVRASERTGLRLPAFGHIIPAFLVRR